MDIGPKKELKQYTEFGKSVTKLDPILEDKKGHCFNQTGDMSVMKAKGKMYQIWYLALYMIPQIFL